MDLKNRLILEEYRKNREDFLEIEKIVAEKLDGIVEQTGVRLFATQHRVKAENSLAGKLIRNDGWYNSLGDLTDILGARVILYFSDDIDKVGRAVEEAFDIDWENSTDKREIIGAESFGYLSLHRICSLPEGYPENLRKWRFEIQIRTALQHVWSDINHDLGYKNEFGVPRAVTRAFSRVSALLEIADSEFVRARDMMYDYTEDVRGRIIAGQADDVALDTVSLREFVRRNSQMRAFLEKIANIAGAEIEETDPGNYLEQLEWLGIKDLGGMQELLANNEDMAAKFVEATLSEAELDVLSSSAGLRYLCRAELCRRGLPEEKVAEFLALSLKDPARAKRRASYLISSYAKLAAEEE